MTLAIGLAESAVGKLPGRLPLTLSSELALRAVAGAGLQPEDIDGVVAREPAVGGASRHALTVAQYLGIAENVTYLDTNNLGGAGLFAGFLRACQRVEAGLNRAVLLVDCDMVRTGRPRADSAASAAALRHPDWEQPFGMMNVSAYALLAQRYLDRHRLPADALAAIPVALRAHAVTHEGAVYREPLTKADVVASRMVASPLRLLECSPVTDGGIAVVVHKLHGHAQQRIRLLGGSEGYVWDDVSFAGDMTRTGAALSGARAFAQAGLAPRDVDVALLYDSYSIALALELEALGFCAPGTAPAFVADGGIAVGGRIPANTHGGLLSHAHCAGAFHLAEALRQLNGSAQNQVPGAQCALVHGEGGILSANCTLLLGSA